MDIQTIDPKTLDVAHQVDSLFFRFFNENEGIQLSVCRLTSPDAYDEMGRPLARGLYDPALGPTGHEDGPCATCGQSYRFCPGHFGHIELPFAVPNPLLINLHLRLLRASCPSCYRLRIGRVDRELLLARLYFEDAGHPRCAFAAESYRTLRRKSDSSNALTPNENEANMGGHHFIKSWVKYFRGFPQPLLRYVENVDITSNDIIVRNILRAARVAWKHAFEQRALLSKRSNGWKTASATLLKVANGPCPECLRLPMRFRKGYRGRIFRASGSTKTEMLLSATEIERQIGGMWKQDAEIFDLLLGLKGRRDGIVDQQAPHRHLFVSNVLVPPSRFRPASVVGKMAYAAEHPQNHFFKRILTEINVIVAANDHGMEDEADQDDITGENEDVVVQRPTKTRYAEAMVQLQEALCDLYDSASMPRTANSNTKGIGIRQQFEAKTGLLRQHMMGKRVNFSCRSVIGPDVFLDTDEIGIPESFAKLLTIPEPVTPLNEERMRRAVRNGPNVYPGATAVEDWAGGGELRVTKLLASNKTHLKAQASLLMQNRAARANGTNPMSAKMDVDQMGVDSSTASSRNIPKRVQRHLKTGDIVLFNRQPTLHRVSIMAHRVRVLPGDRTIRFHYANCGSYNADFDGDEMNVHVPQDCVAQTEAKELLLSSKHYVVPTSGAPIRGLIQDHIAAATLLSRRDTFLDRQTFMQLLYVATETIMLRPHRIGLQYEQPIPAILKPIPLWTGKQLITAVLSVVRNGRPGLRLDSSSKAKPNIVGPEEAHVIFREGELLQGVIDKNSLGSSMYGIVHAVQEAYGCDASNDFLSSMGRLCLYYTRMHGHTTGVSDLELLPKGDRKRSEIVSEGIRKIGIDVSNAIYSELNSTDSSRRKLARTSSQARRLVEEMVRRDGRQAEDRLDTAMKSALNKVSSAVMKACVPSSLRRPFPDNGFALMTETGAKGSAVNAAQISCLLGSTVLEGARVPRIGGSGATLPCFVPYDPSPLAGGFIAGRFLTGISPQEFFFHAMSGREGLLDTSLKTANSGYLQRCLIKHLEGVQVHYDGSVRDSDGSVLQFIYGDDGIDPSKSRWLTDKLNWQVKNKKCLQLPAENADEEVLRLREARSAMSSSDGEPPAGTILESVSPAPLSRRGAISQNFDAMIQDVVAGEDDSNGDIRSFLEGRYQAGAAEAGEAVGIIAAQGVGEPSTQMTLNTFHHAGSSSAHVTLGIPRLRELLMSASQYPKTPSMTLPILDQLGKDGAVALRQRLQTVSFIDLLLRLELKEKCLHFNSNLGPSALRTLTVFLYVPEEDVYRESLGLKFTDLVNFVEKVFVPCMSEIVRNEFKRVCAEDASAKRNESFKMYLHVSKTRFEDEATSSSIGGQQGVHEEDLGDGVPDYGNTNDEETDVQNGGFQSSSGEEDDDSENENDEDKGNDGAYASGMEEDENEESGSDREDKIDREEKKRKSSGKRKRRKSSSRPNVSAANVLLNDNENSDMNALGFKRSSIRTRNKNTILFDWVLPAEASGRLSMARLVQGSAKTAKLTEIQGISRCFIEEKKGKHTVITEGSNLSSMFEIGEGLIDFDGLITNDMMGILHTYGVEAMRTALIQEFVKVFDAYGIPVNIRHLQLIADYMTAHGSYRGFNRRHMQDTPSPFQCMTFETSVNFLTDAALNATRESMKNPSAAIAVSQLTEGGTGAFQLVHRVQ